MNYFTLKVIFIRIISFITSSFIFSDLEIDYRSAGKEMIRQLEGKFSTLTKASDKVHALSVLPQSWSISKIQNIFNVTKHMVCKTKTLVSAEGVLCTPKPKKGKTLSEEVKVIVKDFYYDIDISREMPGMKDCVTVRDEHGRKEKKQKRLVLANLSEIHQAFKEKFPDVKVGFSKFAEWRPRECVLAGSSGTHTVCVCTTHQNFKLMVYDSGLLPLTFNGKKIVTHKDFLTAIKCDPPTEACHYRTCETCNDVVSEFKDFVLQTFEEEFIDSIEYNQWVQVDRCKFEKFIKPVDEFVEEFFEQLEALSSHDYTAKQQSAFFKQTKASLKEGEVLAVGDYAQNYAFVLQDSVQGFHWNNDQATVHPFACYVNRNGAVEKLGVVMISDDLDHHTKAVHYFQKVLVDVLKTEIPGEIKKIIYMSDGCPSQYKNRFNAHNLCLHQNDFGVPAQWHFFPTAHGKGPSDGLSGTVKRLASKASLQLSYDKQIRTPFELFSWAEKNITGLTFKYVDKKDVADNEKILRRRWKNTPALKNIRTFHALFPQHEGRILVKQHSLQCEGTTIDFVHGLQPTSEPEPRETR